jgi:SAM-dependent methyltransferase
MYLLQDKNTPYGVVYHPHEFAIALEAPSEPSDDSVCERSVFLRGHASVDTFLRAGGWEQLIFCLPADEQLWSSAAEEGLVQVSSAGRPWLFSPARALSNDIRVIEEALEPSRGRRMRALDVGCGSGRDIAWLAARGGGQLWHVVGLDSWFSALVRAQELLQRLAADVDGADPQVSLHLADLDAGTGEFVPLPLPTKGRDSHALCFGRQFIARTPLPDHADAYDLVLCVRILERSFLPRIRWLLRTGGFVVYCTFLDMPGTRAFGRPTGHERLLQPAELSTEHFGPDQGFSILRDEQFVDVQGRELCMFVAKRA